MTQLSKNFTLEEFQVSGSHPQLVKPVPAELVGNVQALVTDVFQPLRDGYGGPIRITSGYRPDALNKAVGGSPTSQHRFAQAADWTCPWLVDVFQALMISRKWFRIGQTILYPDRVFCHVALPTSKYNKPMFFIHSPKFGLQYQRVETLKDFKRELARVKL